MSETEVRPVHVYARTSDQTTQLEIIQVKAEFDFVHVILVETKVTKKLDQSGDKHFGSASIEVRATYLSGDCLAPGDLVSDMGGKMDSHSRSVKLTNGGVILKDGMRGLHIGSFMFRKIIEWAQEFDQTFRIVPIGVIAEDADHDNKERRNKMYEHAGLRFIWEPGKFGLAGRTDPALQIADLKLHPIGANITRDYHLNALDRLWRDLAVANDKVKGLRAGNRYYRIQANRVRERLRTAMAFINWPMYIVLTCLGIGIGRGIEWLQETFPGIFS